MQHTPREQKPSQFVTPVTVFGNLAFVSGQLPRENGTMKYAGKVGADVSVDDAQKAAALCARACLDALAHALSHGPSSHRRIAQIVKITGFVASAPDFTGQGKVIDGASRVLIDTLGERGNHARSAIGVQQLPHGASVEVEMIVGLA
ncbi:enamine deaminase RidA (YjgF/YER057c/UK114 family) [Paraburkholderia caballeronis]|uniref:RidA family protein n=1 Tax=Paraburkholderia caballeronis TaxID=416943 RepID=UPI00106546B5|nr:RidA family protein [Paraburkholderia caballeronis]TDV33860.1 enamine deaminase RidA (YjgF/YER057c/UK114 family) [Paraburkholderia caballeronis]